MANNTLALRLESELSALRAGYANPIPLHFVCGDGFGVRQLKSNHTKNGVVAFWHPQRESNP